MDRDQFVEICRIVSRLVEYKDAFRVLYAIGGIESSFGVNAVPRFERGYGRGGRYFDDRLHGKWGDLAACSFGPWQIMFPNAVRMVEDITPVRLQDSLAAGVVSALWLDREVIDRRGARTAEQIFDAWNSGSFRDSNVPEQYIRLALKYFHQAPA